MVTASGIVTVSKRPYSAPVESGVRYQGLGEGGGSAATVPGGKIDILKKVVIFCAQQILNS
jgi:hypothetical protein